MQPLMSEKSLQLVYNVYLPSFLLEFPVHQCYHHVLLSACANGSLAKTASRCMFSAVLCKYSLRTCNVHVLCTHDCIMWIQPLLQYM